MRRPGRRASGTRTVGDVLKGMLGRGGPTPEDDLRDYAAGVALRVTAFRPRQGELVLRRDAPVEWLPWPRGAAQRLAEPVRFVRVVCRAGVYDTVEIQAGDETLTLRAPARDVPLLRAALG